MPCSAFYVCVCQTQRCEVCSKSNYKIVPFVQYKRMSLERCILFSQSGVVSPLQCKYLLMCECIVWLSCIWAIQNAKHLNLTWVLNCIPQANKRRVLNFIVCLFYRWYKWTVTNKSAWRIQIDFHSCCPVAEINSAAELK